MMGKTEDTVHQSRRILFADDDESLQTAVERLARGRGHEVLHAICQMHGPHRGEYLRLHLDLQRRNSQPIEEIYVALIEGGTLAFVRDNPEAWAWIQGGKYREPKP